MTDKKLSRSMEILEVVIQMITFYSAFMAVYFGALQKPVSQLWKSLIIFVFVAAAYYSRRKIKLFKPFIVLHIAIIAAAFFMGTTIQQIIKAPKTRLMIFFVLPSVTKV